MAKGISSRNSLKALAYPVQTFIASWGAGERPSRPAGLQAVWPARYELAALRGEGILRERFFNALMAKIPLQLEADQQVALWHELVEQSGHITAWVQRLGIASALRREALMPENAGHESRKLYCVLLDALAQHAPEHLPWAVEKYFLHIWKLRFPDKPAPVARDATRAEIKRERLVRALRKQHAEAVEVKESFLAGDVSVSFALLIKRESVGRWEELLSVERPRLKTARLAAYDAALDTAASELPGA